MEAAIIPTIAPLGPRIGLDQGKKLPGREGIPTHQQINDQEDRMVEITAREQKIEKRMKRNEESLRALWDNIKYSNIHILSIPEGQGGEKIPEKIFEEIIAENS